MILTSALEGSAFNIPRIDILNRITQVRWGVTKADCSMGIWGLWSLALSLVWGIDLRGGLTIRDALIVGHPGNINSPFTFSPS